MSMQPSIICDLRVSVRDLREPLGCHSNSTQVGRIVVKIGTNIDCLDCHSTATNPSLPQNMQLQASKFLDALATHLVGPVMDHVQLMYDSQCTVTKAHVGTELREALLIDVAPDNIAAFSSVFDVVFDTEWCAVFESGSRSYAHKWDWDHLRSLSVHACRRFSNGAAMIDCGSPWSELNDRGLCASCEASAIAASSYELHIPAARVRDDLEKAGCAWKMDGDAPLFLAAVLQYVTAEILDVSSLAAKAEGSAVIKERHILEAVAEDDELCELHKMNGGNQ